MAIAQSSPGQTIVIIGGGFGGVRAALDLSKKRLPSTRIVLISDKTYLEYFAALYRVVVGGSPLEMCIPLQTIFKNTAVELIYETVTHVDFKHKVAVLKSGLFVSYNTLILAVGSESAYFNIPGIREYSYGARSVHEALKLKRHLHELFESTKQASSDFKRSGGHVVIIGGGPTGVELAGELGWYTRLLAQKHGFPSFFLTIDLIEGMPRLLPMLSEKISERVKQHLQSLGINIFLNRSILKGDFEEVYLSDLRMKTKTLIWTAGTKVNSLLSSLQGLEYDSKRRVVVTSTLAAKGFPEVYIIGDAAATVYSGMAQTAVDQGRYVAFLLHQKGLGKKEFPYAPRLPVYAIPVGPHWAVVSWKRWMVYGGIGWLLRRMADFKVYCSILPFYKACIVFFSGYSLTESCPLCLSKSPECAC